MGSSVSGLSGAPKHDNTLKARWQIYTEVTEAINAAEAAEAEQKAPHCVKLTLYFFQMILGWIESIVQWLIHLIIAILWWLLVCFCCNRIPVAKINLAYHTFALNGYLAGLSVFCYNLYTPWAPVYLYTSYTPIARYANAAWYIAF
jgi:hypothetical protein